MQNHNHDTDRKLLIATLSISGVTLVMSSIFFLKSFSNTANHAVLGYQTTAQYQQLQQQIQQRTQQIQQKIVLPTSAPLPPTVQSLLKAYTKPIKTSIRATALLGNGTKKNLKNADRAIFTTRFKNTTGSDLKNVQMIFHSKGGVKYTMGAVKNARFDRSVQAPKGYMVFNLGDVKAGAGKTVTFFVVGQTKGNLNLSSEVRTAQGLVDKMNPVSITVK